MPDLVVLAWGSLVWDPRTLAMDGDWSPDGPTLPIEFSRIAADGRLTLIVDPVHGVPCVTWVCRSPLALDEAITNLAEREGCGEEWIGRVDVASPQPDEPSSPASETVAEWCRASGHGAAIWTALPSTFRERTGEPFSVDAAVRYLGSLEGSPRNRAFEYVRRAPVTTETPLRAAFGPTSLEAGASRLSEDVRASALLDQLTELDEREAEVRKNRTGWKRRGFFLGILGLSALSLELNSIDALVPALLLGFIVSTPRYLIRHLTLRRIGRERTRLLALYDAIDRAAKLGKPAAAQLENKDP